MADIIDFRVKNGLIVTTTATIEGSAQATSTSTGGLLVRSGAGIGGNLFVGGLTNIAGATTITNTTNASSTLTGALQVRGGAGIGQDVYIGGNLNVTGSISGTLAGNATTVSTVRQTNSSTYFLTFVDSDNASATAESVFTTATLVVNPNTQFVGIGTGTPTATLTVGGGTRISGITTVTNTTNATSTSTGALQVVGGVGIGGDLRVGGSIFGTIGAAVTTATNIAGGGPGMVVYQSSTATTAFVATGTAGTVLVSNGSGSAPSFNNTLTLAGTGTAGTTASGALQVVGGVGIGGNLVVGGSSTITNSLIIAGSTNANSTATGALIVSGGGLGVNGNSYIGGNEFIVGDLEIRGGDLLANVATTFNLINTTATTINFGGAGTNITIGATSGATTVRNDTTVTSITAATTTATGALQVRGGVGVGGALVVGGAGNVGGDLTVGGDLSVNGGDIFTNQTTFNLVNTTATTINFGGAGTNITIGASGSGATTVRNKFTVTDTTNATSTITGAISVRGGVGIGQNLWVGGTSASTTTITSNALYVAGGAGVAGSLYVQGKAYFQDDVIFSGTSTYVYSTQTLYTDNLINLHVPSGATGTSHTWALDDGKDIGHVFHYYTGTDKDAFLGLASGSKFLEWWENGTESNGVWTGTTYGIFRTGGIRLLHTTASTTTATGALTVAGGVGIGGNMFVGGSITVSGTINASVTGVITTATNIQGGTAGQVPYQTGAGLTSFFGPGTAGNVLVSNGTSAPSYNNTLTLAGTTAASSTQTGALQVRGGIGAGNLFVNNAKIISANTDGNTVATIPLDVQGAWIRIGDATTGFAQAGGGIGIKLHDSGNTHWSLAMTNTSFVIAITSSNGDQLLPATRTDALLIDGNGHINGSGNINAGGDVAVNGGDIITNQTTFNLINTTATTINFGGASTALTVGANAAGFVLIQNNSDATSTATGALRVNGGLGVNRDIWVGQRLNVAGDAIVTGDIAVNGGDIITNQTTFNLINTTATTVNFAGASTVLNIGAAGAGYVQVKNNSAATSTATGALRVDGGLGVNGAIYGGNIFSNGSQVIPFKMEEFTASASQTTFTVTGGYVVGTVMVFVNGVFMNSGDFTASNGTTVVLTFARNAGDVVKIVSGGTSSSSNQQQSFSIAMSVALS